MSEPFVGEIRMFAGNFAPRGWAFCDGQLLAVSQNDALFSLLGTIYGGDGRTTFGLPDLRGANPGPCRHRTGAEPAASGRQGRGRGRHADRQPAALSTTTSRCRRRPAPEPPTIRKGAVAANSPSVELWIEDTQGTNLSTSAMTNLGGSRKHTNLMPFLCIHFIIALFGIYPSRH